MRVQTDAPKLHTRPRGTKRPDDGRFSHFYRWLTQRHTLESAEPPILIGGTGGSGTRVIVQILADAGFYAGADLNPRTLDAPDMGRFIAHWSKLRLRQRRLRKRLDPARDRLLTVALEAACVAHRREVSDQGQPWLIKNPRIWMLLPDFHARFPRLKFVHMIRDGRDMAFSANQRQVKKYGWHFIRNRYTDEPLAVRSAAYWSVSNCEIRQTGVRLLGDNYLCLRFEDLCARPEETVSRLLTFCAAPEQDVAAAAARVKPPSTIGRFREKDTVLVRRVSEIAADGLADFGYTDR
jgi:hypothetical protein